MREEEIRPIDDRPTWPRMVEPALTVADCDFSDADRWLRERRVHARVADHEMGAPLEAVAPEGWIS